MPACLVDRWRRGLNCTAGSAATCPADVLVQSRQALVLHLLMWRRATLRPGRLRLRPPPWQACLDFISHGLCRAFLCPHRGPIAKPYDMHLFVPGDPHCCVMPVS